MPGEIYTIAKPRSHASLRGEQGFTLLELMIAVTVSTVVIGTVSLTMIAASRSVLSIRQDAITTSFRSQISSILRDPILCAAAFKTAPAGALGVPIDINPTAALPIAVPRLEFNGSVLAETGKRTGADLSGVIINSINLDNPTLVSGARYRWSLKIQTQKADAQGNALSGTVQMHNFRLTITTNDGSPDYHVLACGIEVRDPLTVPPPPITMGRGLYTIAQANTGTKRADECNAIGSDYVPATRMDFVQVGATIGNNGVVPAGAQPFLVQDDTANAYVLLHPPNATPPVGMELHNAGPVGGQVACVHRTAPIRFTNATLSANFAANAGQGPHDLECDKAFGSNYIAANYSDLFAYGFMEVATGGVPATAGAFGNNYLDVTLGGAAGTCRLGYVMAPRIIGLAIDCTQAAAQQNQIGCVTRSK